MIIFIRNIPQNTTKIELEDFVEPALKRLLFRSGSIVKVEVLTLRNKLTNALQCHGLVYTDSEKTGRMAIKKLNMKLFNNRKVIVREYMLRSFHNDRRNHAELNDAIIQKRIKDRRAGSNLEAIKGQPFDIKAYDVAKVRL
jgi:RNA recognition motif-containing protein